MAEEYDYNFDTRIVMMLHDDTDVDATIDFMMSDFE